MTNARTQRVAWVTGASSGLGKATALALHKAGWQVAAGARSFAGDMPDMGGLLRLPLDVTDQASVDAFAAEAASRLGTPDALVLAAGILVLGPAGTLMDAELRSVLDVCLLGTLRLVRAALPLFADNGGGKIAVFSSINGLLPTPFQGAYVAAKHALEGYSECLAMETAGQGIQVMIVEPGDHQGGSSRYRTSAQAVSPLYEASFARAREVVLRDEAGGGSPAAFARKLARVMGRRRLPLRLKVTTLKENAAIVLHDVLPGRWFLKSLRDYYKV